MHTDLSTWPDAFNTTSGVTAGHSTSSMLSSSTKWLRQACTRHDSQGVRGPAPGSGCCTGVKMEEALGLLPYLAAAAAGAVAAL